jgi:hypothetical protein
MLFLGSLAGHGLWLTALFLYLTYNGIISLISALGARAASRPPRRPFKHERLYTILLAYGPFTLGWIYLLIFGVK